MQNKGLMTSKRLGCCSFVAPNYLLQLPAAKRASSSAKDSTRFSGKESSSLPRFIMVLSIRAMTARLSDQQTPEIVRGMRFRTTSRRATSRRLTLEILHHWHIPWKNRMLVHGLAIVFIGHLELGPAKRKQLGPRRQARSGATSARHNVEPFTQPVVTSAKSSRLRSPVFGAQPLWRPF